MMIDGILQCNYCSIAPFISFIDIHRFMADAGMILTLVNRK